MKIVCVRAWSCVRNWACAWRLLCSPTCARLQAGTAVAQGGGGAHVERRSYLQYSYLRCAQRPGHGPLRVDSMALRPLLRSTVPAAGVLALQLFQYEHVNGRAQA